MAVTEYLDVYDRVIVRGNTKDMEFPADQEQFIKRRSRSILWQPTWESRCHDYPMWERGDILRDVSFQDIINLDFGYPKVAYPASTVSPTGDIVLDIVERGTPIILADNIKYHYNTQRLYALMSQFNILTEQQMAAYLSISIQEAHQAAVTLMTCGILEQPYGEWIHEENLGKIWRLRYNTLEYASYFDGMDPVYQMISLGSADNANKPTSPGAHTMASTRHNLFLAEIMLRICEVGDNIIGVWGDFFASEELFHTKHDGMKARKSHGDAIAVTNNGSIIVFELSTHLLDPGQGHSRIIAEKAASWLGVISNTELDISVIFIDTRWRRNGPNLYRSISYGIDKLGPLYAPDDYRRKHSIKKIGLVDAGWWFPTDRTTSKAVTRLTAFNPTTHRFYHFDKPDAFFSTDSLRRNVIVNTAAALHTPSWMNNKFISRSLID